MVSQYKWAMGADSVHTSVMDWAVDTTGLIITSVTCCGQEAKSMSDTSGGRSGTWSCWWMVDQICADPVWPPNSWMRRTSNSSTADLHVERQPVLSIASVSSSEGVMPHWVIVLFRQSLYLLYLYTSNDYILCCALCQDLLGKEQKLAQFIADPSIQRITKRGNVVSRTVVLHPVLGFPL